jgi:hypothetical protein
MTETKPSHATSAVRILHMPFQASEVPLTRCYKRFCFYCATLLLKTVLWKLLLAASFIQQEQCALICDKKITQTVRKRLTSTVLPLPHHKSNYGKQNQ